MRCCDGFVKSYAAQGQMWSITRLSSWRLSHMSSPRCAMSSCTVHPSNAFVFAALLVPCAFIAALILPRHRPVAAKCLSDRRRSLQYSLKCRFFFTALMALRTQCQTATEPTARSFAVFSRDLPRVDLPGSVFDAATCRISRACRFRALCRTLVIALCTQIHTAGESNALVFAIFCRLWAGILPEIPRVCICVQGQG